MKPSSEPLGMTVHSLPQPVDALTQQRASGRLKMLLIMAACAAPVIASYSLYYGVRPTGGATAYSTLIQPTVPMPAVPATPLAGGWPASGCWSWSMAAPAARPARSGCTCSASCAR